MGPLRIAAASINEIYFHDYTKYAVDINFPAPEEEETLEMLSDKGIPLSKVYHSFCFLLC
jgi:hypothetical protein